MAFLDETGLAELWSLILAEDSNRAEIAIGSYVGTGSTDPNSLTFDFEPKLVIIASASYYWEQLILINPATTAAITRASSTGVGVSVTWSGNSVTWSQSSVDYMLNKAGYSYYYIAFGGNASTGSFANSSVAITLSEGDNAEGSPPTGDYTITYGMTWAEVVAAGTLGLYVSIASDGRVMYHVEGTSEKTGTYESTCYIGAYGSDVVTAGTYYWNAD